MSKKEGAWGLTKWIVLLCIFIGVSSAWSHDFRIFTDIKGRTVEARLITPKPNQDKAFIELRNGQQDWIALEQLSEADQEYIAQICREADFMNPERFCIEVQQVDSSWETNRELGRETRKSHFTIAMMNKSNSSIDPLHIEYCTYWNKKNHAREYTFQKAEEIPMASVPPKGTCERTTAPVCSLNEYGLQSTVMGVCVRIILTLDDGSTRFREIRIGSVTDPEKYPFKNNESNSAQNKQYAATPAIAKQLPPLLPEGAIPGQLTRNDVRWIAEKYVQAWEESDIELYKRLMSYACRRIADDTLIRTGVKDMSISKIDGLNVKLKFDFKGRTLHSEWLQIQPNGYIKYAPFYSLHPVEQAFMRVYYLTADTPLRRTAIAQIKRVGAPSFGYDINASQEQQEKAAEKITDWLIENGEELDLSKPELPMPKEVFNKYRSMYK